MSAEDAKTLLSSRQSGAISECSFCGLKFGLLSNQKRQAHINQCLDLGGASSNSEDAQAQLSSDSSRSAQSALLKGKERCPTCEKDLTSYTPTRRTQHVNRCLDQSKGIYIGDIDSIRAALEDDTSEKRKTFASLSKTSRHELPSNAIDTLSSSETRPPPTTMIMTSKEYVCPICHKKLANSLKSRLTHVAACANKNEIDSEELGRLKREQDAVLIAERAAWEEAHPEFQRMDESCSQSPLAAPLTTSSNTTSIKKRKSYHATTVTAQVEALQAEHSLQRFFPSQQLRAPPSPNSSTESHHFTWLSNSPSETPTEKVSHTAQEAFHLSDASPPKSSPLRRAKRKKSTMIHLEEEEYAQTETTHSTQRPGSSTVGKIASLAVFEEESADFDDLLDAPFSSAPTRSSKRSSNDAIDEWYAGGVKRPKSSSSAAPSSAVSSSQHQIILIDSPATTPISSQTKKADRNEGKKQISENDDDSSVSEDSLMNPTPPSSQDGLIVKFNKPKPSESQQTEDEKYFEIPLSERLRLAHERSIPKETSLKSSSLPVMMTLDDDEEAESEENLELENPPLVRNVTPVLETPEPIAQPKPKSMSQNCGVTDLTSPVKQKISSPLSPRRQPISSSTQNETIAIPSNNNSIHHSSRGVASEASNKENASPFDLELDAIILRFQKLEKQAQESYYATLGRLAVQREQQVKTLASNFSTPVATAMVALHMRTAKLTSTSQYDDFGEAAEPSGGDMRQIPINPLNDTFSARLVENRNTIDQRDILRDEGNSQTVVQQRRASSSQNVSAAPLVQVERTQSLSLASEIRSSTVLSTNASDINLMESPTMPNFENMTNPELAGLAKKYALSNSIPRTMLVSQLGALWKFHRESAASSAAVERVLSNSTLNLAGAVQRIESFANPNSNGNNSNPTSLNNISATLVSTSIATTSKRTTKAKSSRSARATSSNAPSSNNPSTDNAMSLDNHNSSDSNSNGEFAAEQNFDTSGSTLSEKLDNYIRSNIDLYASILQFTAVNIVEFQAMLKKAKIKASRVELQEYLQSKSVLCTKKPAKATASKVSAAVPSSSTNK